ncbi:hypothetical protein GALL_508540 [mine drainage metagenome]|uniref:Uncharacterized protein n=1 Tax=mine drainage metagenome TaxID=410659 RepID=A0A1J5PVF1_9ZZZZ
MRCIELQNVVPCRFLRGGGPVVEQRPHARIRPDDHVRRHRLAQIGAGGAAQIFDFRRAGVDVGRVAGEVQIGGADQGKVVFIGNQEEDAVVCVLENIAEIPVVQLGDDDVAPLNKANRCRNVCADHRTADVGDPRARRVDQRARPDCAAFPGLLVPQGYRPQAVGAFGRHAGGAGRDRGAAIGGIAGVQHHQAGIFHPAVGIFEAAGEFRLQNGAGGNVAQPQGAGGRQALASAQVVIQEQAQAQHPGRTQLVVMRQHEAQRPDDMRCDAPQDLAFHQCFAHQPEFIVF